MPSRSASFSYVAIAVALYPPVARHAEWRRNPVTSKIHAFLFVEEALNILGKACSRGRVEPSVVRITSLEVVEHRKERRLNLARRCDHANGHGGGLTLQVTQFAGR
jgi:hypothetical protein